MLATSLSICARCRHSLHAERISRTLATTSQKAYNSYYTKQYGERRKTPPYPPPSYNPRNNDAFRPFRHREGGGSHRNEPRRTARDKLHEGLREWIKRPQTIQRLVTMGLEEEHASQLLNTFLEATPRTPGGWFPRSEDEKWEMKRIEEEISMRGFPAFDGPFTRRFLDWALNAPRARELIPPSTHSALSAVYDAVDYMHPAEWYPKARMRRRQVHMHVGPTNSGKTHAALRALAAAKTGVYASPLRLLAFEVFERLNKGKIIPAGADPNAPPETYKRTCNLLTGEEERVVEEECGLLSCTIEMFSSQRNFDVAVVDEIQMLSDPERGGAWTAAVLGLDAKEVHLCGEAGAVPLVQSMLKNTGDEIIVHRYERLTPLTVAKKSLEGDLTKIRKGDCVVAFSRSMIFSLKKQIEKATGLRCALVYGRLPPEVRTEQAELFNNPDNSYDVLIGSDAIGMGLNLMIKRIVFEASRKFNGNKEIQLSLSQLKQIAGRAGRFGMHGDDAGGIVTSLYEEDLDVVRQAVDSRAVPLSKRATLPLSIQTFSKLEQLLRPGTGFKAMFDIQNTAARIPSNYALPDRRHLDDAIAAIDMLCVGQTLEERIRVMLSPVPWRDEVVVTAMQRFLLMYREDFHVRLKPACSELRLLEELERIKVLRSVEGSQNVTAEMLVKLESLYRVIMVYMWFSMRLPIIFSEREEAVQLKQDCEDTIEWCLEHIAHRSRKGLKFRLQNKSAPVVIDGPPVVGTRSEVII